MLGITSINPEVNESNPPVVVERGLIDKYCEANTIDVHQLLVEITEKGSADLSDFIVSQGGPEISDKSPGILHGSPTLIEEFEPRVSTGGKNKNKAEPLVYGTNGPEYAIFLGITHRKGGMCSAGYKKNGDFDCSIDLEFINSPSEIKDGFVYVLDKNLFEEDRDYQFTSPYKQRPILAIPVKPQDLRAPIVVETGKVY